MRGGTILVVLERCQLALRAQIGDLVSENASLKRRLDSALRTIEGARSAAAVLLDRTAQQGMDI